MNLITWFLVGIFIIIILGIVGNTGQSSILNIQDQLFLINCPDPIFEGVATNVTISGFAVFYTITHDRDINGNFTSNDQDKVGTEFDCTVTNHLFGVSTSTREYGATLFSVINYGWFGYVADWLSHTLEKASSLFVLIAYFVTPSNFDIMGFTLDDLEGIALIIILGVYVFCYIPIAIFVYKAISPFVGGF